LPSQTTPSISQPEVPKTETVQTPTNTAKMSETEQRERSPDVDDDDTKEIKLTPRKVYKFDDPPFVFRDVDVSLGYLLSIFVRF